MRKIAFHFNAGYREDFGKLHAEYSVAKDQWIKLDLPIDDNHERVAIVPPGGSSFFHLRAWISVRQKPLDHALAWFLGSNLPIQEAISGVEPCFGIVADPVSKAP